jgi:hypothetical protein
MRRLTDAEMVQHIKLARDGAKGPGRALEALSDLILRDAEGVGVAEAAACTPKFRVRDYAMAAEQAQQLHDAMTKRRRLPERTIDGIGMLGIDQSPCDYSPEDGHG